MSYFMTKMMERQNGVEDLCMMNSTGVDAIVSQLRARLDKNKIYTAIGDVLIAVNPYRSLPIYGPDHVRMYQTANMSDSSPHVYALAERSYRKMSELKQPQAVIISGESGAGKTESAKLLLHYVSSVSGNSATSQRMKQIILESNPLLESFGNAKTIRNNNSSRFGKYLELLFNDRSEPVGGTTSNFLLEKTRVTFQGKNERNFHIFYQVLAGAWPELLQQCQLGAPTDYYYLSQSGCTYVDGVDDKQEFAEVLQAMNTVNMSGEEQWYIMTCLAGILHLGNAQLRGKDQPQLAQGADYSLGMAAYLFGVDAQDLLKSITHKTIKMGGRRGSVVQVPQNADQSTQIRDALAKETYSRIFDLIVYRVNQCMHTREQRPGCSIGILDIYGFEIFQTNSFEQFCINYVNEKLQQIFIELTVRGEQREYHEEGIPWKNIDFFDNAVVVGLIEGAQPPGIMRILDDTCRSLHAVESDQLDINFIQKLGQSGVGNHPHLRILSSTSAHSAAFTVKHYAGDVTYSVREFGFKNMDNLFNSLVNCMKTSQNPFVKTLWANDEAAPRQPTTSSQKIRTSCNALVQSLMRCTPHYIRCIKPNERKAPMTVEEKRVIHQVKYLGLVENVKVKKAGYSYRAPYNLFLQRFHMLSQNGIQTGGVDGCRELCQFISKKHGNEIPLSEWCFGRSKIFVNSPQTVFLLEEYREEKMDPVGYAQKVKEHEQMEKMAEKQEAKVSTRNSKSCCIIS